MASEFDAMKTIDELLASLNDEERGRVLQWVSAKYGLTVQNMVRAGVRLDRNESALSVAKASGGVKEIPGIARLTTDGNLKLTVRDVKAKNTNDAAIRLIHIVVLANELLTGESGVSGKSVVVPTLREWRAYTGNTRAMIAKN